MVGCRCIPLHLHSIIFRHVVSTVLFWDNQNANQHRHQIHLASASGTRRCPTALPNTGQIGAADELLACTVRRRLDLAPGDDRSHIAAAGFAREQCASALQNAAAVRSPLFIKAPSIESARDNKRSAAVISRNFIDQSLASGRHFLYFLWPMIPPRIWSR